jgi:lysophospholipase L1-like esterase
MGAAFALVSAVATFALTGSALAATHHRASGPSRVVAGSQYLALGDSVTFGFQEPQVVPAPNYKNASSFVAYPEMLASELHLKLANAACPGETSSSFINPSAQSNGCENSPGQPGVGYRTTAPQSGPLHVNYQGSQLAYAVKYLRTHHNVSLVSLMIGANDGLLCVETSKDGCSSPSELAGVTQLLTQNLHQILKAIRHKAHYKGQLVVLDYFSPLIALNNYTTILNTAINAAVKPYKARIADGYSAFATADAQSAGNACSAGLLTQLGSPSVCGIHPSYAGQAILAQAVEKALKL